MNSRTADATHTVSRRPHHFALRTNPRVLPMALLGGIAAAGLTWSLFITTPFLQEDYGFLYEARQPRFQTLTSALLRPSGGGHFWRPLSVNLYWQFVNTVLGGNALATHAVNLSFLALSSAAIGVLAIRCAARIRGSVFPTQAFWSAFLYGSHGAWFLPAVWASCVQESMALLFFVVTLLVWLHLAACPPLASRWPTIAAGLTTLALSLLCKEGSAVLPFAAAALVYAVADRTGLRRILPLFASSCGLIAVWFAFRHQLVRNPSSDSPYALQFGGNTIRNGAALSAFALGVPREAIRAWIEQRSIYAAVWGGSCFVLQGAASGLLFIQAGKGGMQYRHAAGLAAASAITLTPYLLLRWNCYAYYVLPALVPYAILVALAGSSGTRSRAAIAAAVTASLLLAVGEQFCPWPAPAARARWAQNALAQLHANETLRLIASREPLVVDAEDYSRFSALGSRAGLAAALGTDEERILILQEHPELDREKTGARLLHFRANGTIELASAIEMAPPVPPGDGLSNVRAPWTRNDASTTSSAPPRR